MNDIVAFMMILFSTKFRSLLSNISKLDSAFEILSFCLGITIQEGEHGCRGWPRISRQGSLMLYNSQANPLPGLAFSDDH